MNTNIANHIHSLGNTCEDIFVRNGRRQCWFDRALKYHRLARCLREFPVDISILSPRNLRTLNGVDNVALSYIISFYRGEPSVSYILNLEVQKLEKSLPFICFNEELAKLVQDAADNGWNNGYLKENKSLFREAMLIRTHPLAIITREDLRSVIKEYKLVLPFLLEFQKTFPKGVFGKLVEKVDNGEVSFDYLVRWLKTKDSQLFSIFRSESSTFSDCRDFLKDTVETVELHGVTFVRSSRMGELVRDDLPERPLVIYSDDKHRLYAIFGLKMEDSMHLLYIIA